LRRCDGGYGAADFIEHKIIAGENKLIGNPQDVVATSPQLAIAGGVVQLLFNAFVWRAVEFNDQTVLDTQEIGDESSDRNLPSEFQTIQAAGAQGAPENDLGGRHVSAKAASKHGLTGADASGHRPCSNAGAFPSSEFRRREPSSDPCFARATFSRKREKESAIGR
jgi:hypothetical protein